MALPSQVFWSVEDALNMARLLVNDVQNGLAGQELADSQPFTWVLVNLAYANLQKAIGDGDADTVSYAETTILALEPSPTAQTDPNAQVVITYLGYLDGTDPIDASKGLPADFQEPLKLWERPSGTNQAFMQMSRKLGGMDPRAGLAYTDQFKYWEFRVVNGVAALVMPAASVAIDLRLRYIPSLATLQMDGSNFPLIPIPRAGEALAYGIAAEWTEIRGALNAPMLRQKYENQVRYLTDNTAIGKPQSYAKEAVDA